MGGVYTGEAPHLGFLLNINLPTHRLFQEWMSLMSDERLMAIRSRPFARLHQARRSARRRDAVLRTAYWVYMNYCRLFEGREPRWGCQVCGEVWGTIYKFHRDRQQRLCETCKSIITELMQFAVWQRAQPQYERENEHCWPNSDDDCSSEVSELTHQRHPETTLDDQVWPSVYAFDTIVLDPVEEGLL